MTDAAELGLVERVPARLGVAIDQDDLDRVEEHLRQNVAESEERMSDEDEDSELRSSSGIRGDPRREVEAIFARLADID
jgi:hypothetical protein